MEAVQTDLNTSLIMSSLCQYNVRTIQGYFRMLLLYSVLLVDVVLPTFFNEVLALGPLIFTELSPFFVFPQLAQRRCDNVVTKSWLTLSQRCGTVENKSCADVSFSRCDNFPLRGCQDVDIKLLQRRHNIKHWISRPSYYRLFWFLSHHQNVRELQKC